MSDFSDLCNDDALDGVPRATAALLVVDAQNDYLHADGAISKLTGIDMSSGRATVPRLNQLIRAARAAEVPVVYLRNVHAEWNTLPNKRSRRKSGPGNLWPEDGTWGADWYEQLERPADRDIVITKHNYDSFQDSPLALHLRSMGVDSIITAGYATEVCLESTCRRGFVEGFYVYIPMETTYGFSEAAVRASLRILGERFGTILSADRVEQEWASGAGGR